MNAIFFDMDGLLIDSEPAWRAAEVACLGEVGIALHEDDCHQTTGLRIDEVVAHWVQRRGSESSLRSTHRVVERIVDRMVQWVSSEGEPLEGARDAVALCKRRGHPVALVSSSPERLIEATLARLDLGFDLVVSAEHERYGKPHPGVYLTAADRLSVEPTTCIVIEDSLNGVLAAKAARMRCIAVPAPDARKDPRFTIADRVLPSLAALDDAVLSAQ